MLPFGFVSLPLMKNALKSAWKYKSAIVKLDKLSSFTKKFYDERYFQLY